MLRSYGVSLCLDITRYTAYRHRTKVPSSHRFALIDWCLKASSVCDDQSICRVILPGKDILFVGSSTKAHDTATLGESTLDTCSGKQVKMAHESFEAFVRDASTQHACCDVGQLFDNVCSPMNAMR